MILHVILQSCSSRASSLARERRNHIPQISTVGNMLCARPLVATWLRRLGIRGEVRGERPTVIRVPPRQRRTPLHDICHSPSHAEVVGVRIDLVVGAYHVERPPRHLRLEELHDLTRHPRTRRGLRLVEVHRRRIHVRIRIALAVDEYVGIDPPRHEEVGADLAPWQFAQLVLQSLGVRVQRRLARVVRDVPGRLRDALLRSGVDDDALG